MSDSSSPSSTPPAVRGTGLLRKHGDRTALDHVDFAVHPGERVAILGPNGAGKTTLLEVLAGVQPLDAGSVEPAPQLLGWVPQHPALYGKLTVRENLALFARLAPGARPSKADADAVADRALDFAELRDRSEERLDQLSGGWRQRVSLAIGLLGEPKCVLLDEPHTGLDPPQRAVLWSLIDRLAAGGMAVVITTHELHSAVRHADRVVVLARGHVVFTGTPDELAARGGDEDDLDIAFAHIVEDRLA